MQVLINGVEYIPNPFVNGDRNEFENALNAKASYTDFPDISVREYLCRLLVTLWDEEECFSGKRPFGNSGWAFDLIYSLVACGFIPGTLTVDSDGDLENCIYDQEDANIKIQQLICYCFYGAAQHQ